MGTSPGSGATNVALQDSSDVQGSPDDVVRYDQLDPAQASLASDLKQLEAALLSETASLEAAVGAIEEDERKLRAQEATIKSLARQIDRYTSSYPNGLPPGVYERATEIAREHDRQVSYYNRDVADLNTRRDEAARMMESIDRNEALYAAKWQRLKELARR